MKNLFYATVLAFAPVTACATATGQPAIDRAAIAEEVKANVQTIVTAFDERDAEAGVSTNAPDFIQMFHGQKNADTQADLAFTKEQVADPATKLTIGDPTIDVAQAGDMVLYTTRYAYNFTDPETGEIATEYGNWIMVFKRQPDGSMKIYREIISDTPAE